METITSFKFITVEDCGSACCPHCGAEGRYIYHWEMNGKGYAAMAGCYKALTGHVSKDDKVRYFEILAEKQAKNKTLNGWDKTVIRMQKYALDNIGDSGKVNWALGKIDEALGQRQQFLNKKRF